MKQNPYDILGVSEDANDAEIKKSFRHLARQHHPDMNPDDPHAEERFKEVQAAYALLSDPQQRRQYDAGTGPFASGIDPEMFNLEDLPFDQLFSELFGGSPSRKTFFRFNPLGSEDLDQKIKLRVPASAAKPGTMLAATTADGRRVQFRLPKNSRNGTILRLAKKGMSFQGQSGDLYVELLVSADAEQS